MELQEYREENTQKINEKEKISKIIKAWKILNDIPIEGDASKRWDSVFYPRYCRPAKELLMLFETWETAVDCVQHMTEYFRAKELDFTMETIVKRSDLFREKLARRSK